MSEEAWRWGSWCAGLWTGGGFVLLLAGHWLVGPGMVLFGFWWGANIHLTASGRLSLDRAAVRWLARRVGVLE